MGTHILSVVHRVHFRVVLRLAKSTRFQGRLPVFHHFYPFFNISTLSKYFLKFLPVAVLACRHCLIFIDMNKTHCTTSTTSTTDIDLIRLGGLIGPICRSITSVLDSCLVKKHAGTLLPQMLYYVRAFHLLNRCSAIYVLVPVLV